MPRQCSQFTGQRFHQVSVGTRPKLAGIKRRIERQFVLEFDYDHVISVNNEHVGLLSDHHTNVSCIPNGVDLDRFSNDLERGSDILFLGRLAPKKRVSDLIRAFERVESQFPETDLIVVGTGPREETGRTRGRPKRE
nr:glycosyltransferase [Halomicroarcula sp. SYNS111]